MATQEDEAALKEDIATLNAAVLDLFSTFNTNYGKIKKFKRKGNLIIEARTGGWSENEEAIAKFNETKFDPADIGWWFLYEWKRGGYFKWQIPLFLVNE